MSLSQKASNEFVRLLRERQGALTPEDQETIIGLYVQSGMDRARVEEWLKYTLARLPAVTVVHTPKSNPVKDMPNPVLPSILLPQPNTLMVDVAQRLLNRPAPSVAMTNDFKPPAL